MVSALVDYYRNQLKWPEELNPMMSRDITMYTKGFRKKRAQDPSFNAVRATAFSYQAMERAFVQFDKQGTYQSELFLIISTLAFYLWLRIDEALTLTFGAIQLNQVDRSRHAFNFHTIRVACRKTDKTDTEGHLTLTLGQIYNVYASPNEPFACLFTAIQRWIIFLEKIMKRKLQSNEYLFPLYNSKGGKLDSLNPTTKPFFRSILDTVGGLNHGYTMHCFRRGGGQHKFLYAAKKWTLRSCKWWGGWSAGESTGTLMKVKLIYFSISWMNNMNGN
jgi:hypothetical protein